MGNRDTKCSHGVDFSAYCAQCAAAGRIRPDVVFTTMSPDCGAGVEIKLGIPRDDRLGTFDDATRKVTQDRGAVYGHPRDDFDRAARLKAVVAECPDPLARHAMEMICVKLARLIQSPSHLDSWVDIAGYARTGVMATDPKPPE